MAIVKAEAYGHGADAVARKLRDAGVDTFAVATAEEGVSLRKSGLSGEILVLGYTHPRDAACLNENNLTQLLADGAHAKTLDASGHKLRVHIAVDTGMHRLGIDSAEFTAIEDIYKFRNLSVEGMATHLASSDSLNPDDVAFTKAQLDRFGAVVGELKSKGHDVGKLHTQASYGLLNYPGLECDYARVGIALYGVLSHGSAIIAAPALKPVLSLRATITRVQSIGAGETVSYGRLFMAERPAKIATVGIGYADGIPRQASGNGMQCLVAGQRVPVIGRICMDMLMLDVTGIDCVATGDVVTLIGRDGDSEIRCEELAAAAGTITNDILCRLGSRLPRVYTG